MEKKEEYEDLIATLERVVGALSESEGRLNAIIDGAVDGIITINMDAIIESINPAALLLFQYEESELIGQNINVLMPEPDHSRHNGYMENYHRTGKKKIIGIGRKVLGRKKDGATFPFSLSISEVKLESGTIFTGVIHDMTEEEKAKKELESVNGNLEMLIDERTAELTKMNLDLTREIDKRKKTENDMRRLLEKEVELGELKSRFVSMASHEFRTPLTGIQSASSLIDRYQKTEEAKDRKKLTDMIRKSVGNLTSILNDFLSLDKLESGKVTANLMEFSMHDLSQECIADLDTINGVNKTINVDCSSSSCLVNLDRNILKNVLLNLLSNAIKYTREDGVIDLVAQISNDVLCIDVKDDGIGIPETDQQHLFERFFRANNVTNIKGTGLGLNIVKRYLDLMDGSITFESEVGQGTTFHARIPLKTAQLN